MNDIEHLQWIKNRLVNHYSEDANIDYLKRFQTIIDFLPKVLEAAKIGTTVSVHLPELMKRYERSLVRAEHRLEESKHYNSKDHNFHGGREVGYYTARHTLLEDIVDDLKELT